MDWEHLSEESEKVFIADSRRLSDARGSQTLVQFGPQRQSHDARLNSPQHWTQSSASRAFKALVKASALKGARQDFSFPGADPAFKFEMKENRRRLADDFQLPEEIEAYSSEFVSWTGSLRSHPLIGRVGRAERMGLAISLVSDVPEKVWYHGEWCKSRGKNCFNTRLTSENGCCIWYNEPEFLAETEEHLGVTIQCVGSDLKIPVNEFDGKVVYGERRSNAGSNYQTHVEQLAPTVQELASLEREAQNVYIRRQYGKCYPWLH
ncbi:hypothetical protein FHG87_008988 [Trinorchestia longiramus]|nr:hypothetical protein FHG87_008988 [Trinorchestia longiramus]